eukprot:c47313_g1_i1 orf=2-181(-)
MNTSGISPTRCVQHPCQRIVGVCASCLRDRLQILSEAQRKYGLRFSSCTLDSPSSNGSSF